MTTTINQNQIRDLNTSLSSKLDTDKVIQDLNGGSSNVPSVSAVNNGLNLKENLSNKSDSYTVSSQTTYASTKALVDGLETKADTDLANCSTSAVFFDSNKVDGYSQGAVLDYVTSNGYHNKIISLINNNTNAPNSNNIKTPVSPEGTYYWELIGNAFNNIFFGNSINTKGSIELFGGGSSEVEGAFIDFHFPTTTTNYTSRIIESGEGIIDIKSPNGLKVNGNILSNYFLPNYSAEQSLTIGYDTYYTLNNNGIIVALVRCNDSSNELNIYLKRGNNESRVANHGGYSGTRGDWETTSIFPVKKGDQYKVTRSGTGANLIVLKLVPFISQM